MKSMKHNTILLLLTAVFAIACAELDEIHPEEYIGFYQGNDNFVITNAINLSSEGTANSYIVSKSGTYRISPVKGNSSDKVGNVSSVGILWESFGTYIQPSKCDLLSGVMYKDGSIYFKTSDTFMKGNAVIAAKDANGKILWSWHIWLTYRPQGQVYYNNAGTMMDRNLGATSATPGDVGALGLLYQWGRKDPFLGSSSISSSTVAKSTLTWPSAVSSNSTNGTIEYAVEHPTTFITNNGSNYDWHYTTDDTRWKSVKTIYDPCPSGWRVPDGGDNGVWSTAKGSSSYYDRSYDSTNAGMNFSGDFGGSSNIWYPASGYRRGGDGVLSRVGSNGGYWSFTLSSYGAYYLYNYGGCVYPSDSGNRANGYAVRCVQEGTGGGPQYDSDFSISGAKSLSDAASANSYIVSSAGTYSIPAVKGNSSESVGSVASAEVLWESFCTNEHVFKGNLVSGAKYENGKIYFKTADSYREGNAVIAAKDAAGTILWSWHIWLTDQPQGQVYYNNAGTMMDRNLGATSATPGDVGALGLLYQWGRKDPFLGSSSISSSTVAASTLTWPSVVSTSSSVGTVDYTVANPTTYIKAYSSPYDWHYPSRDNTLWQSDKTIYDPCPSGWRVPDGGDDSVWSKALGSGSYFDYTYDGTNKGMNFYGKFDSASTIWYPASGYRYYDDGVLDDVGYYGNYWSVTPDSGYACTLFFNNDGGVYPSDSSRRAYGFGVRCVQE